MPPYELGPAEHDCVLETMAVLYPTVGLLPP